MFLSTIRERSLCLLNSENLDSTFQPWLTIADAKFHPDISALYSHANINPIQSIQINYLPPFISYLWPLIHQRANIWAVDHPTTRETAQLKFVLKYDLLVWDRLYPTKPSDHPSLNSGIVYPKILILAPDWFTCEHAYKHLSTVKTDRLKNVLIHCIYEGQNNENDLYKKFLTEGCDLLIATPTVVNDLIQKRYIHFERLDMIIFDQFDLLLQTIDPINEICNLIQLHVNKKESIQYVFLSRNVTQQTKDFIFEHFSSDKNYYYLSSSLMETVTYKNFFVYCEPCRNWNERKLIIKDLLDMADRCHKKIIMCACQTRRLATMQSILNDLSIQSVLIHSQLSSDEIQKYAYEWKMINDRLFILLIQDDVLNDITIDSTDIIIHLDVQRLIWYHLYNQRMRLIYKYVLDNNKPNKIRKTELTSLKLFEQFYQHHPLVNIPLVVILWPGDCAHSTYELIDYIKNSNSYLNPLIERLAKNNCYESLQAKINVEFCPTLKMFGRCSNEKILKRCPYKHHFHYNIDYIEQTEINQNENYLTDSYELCLPNQGEIELRVTHVSDGNRLWANILRSRNDANQTLVKIFDYDQFYKQIENAFDYVKNRPLSEIILGEIYLYKDCKNQIHRVYVLDQEQTYFDIRRADAILNRLLKASNTGTNTIENDQQPSTTIEQEKPMTTFDRPMLTVFSLDTGATFSLKSNEFLYPIEPSSLKQYPPLATEIILCNIYPLDKITMTFTPFTIETVRSLTLNEIFMGRIKLATRSCFWIDPLVKPVRLAALKRIAYDKPIRKQLMSLKLIQTNDHHMDLIDHLAAEAQLIQLPPVVNEPEIVKQETIEEPVVEFKPFLNRIGQLIINPVGRSKQFFIKHNQQLSNSDFVKGTQSLVDNPTSMEESLMQVNSITTSTSDRYMSLGRGQRINTEPISLVEDNYDQCISHVTNQQSSIDPSKIMPSEIKDEIDETFEDTVESQIKLGTSNQENTNDDSDQMTFIFGPKLFSQLRQIKDMEEEQRRQADFRVHRNRHRHMRNNNNNSNSKPNNQDNNNDDENDEATEQKPIQVPNMSRYEPFIDERGPLTQEQIDYKQTQHKTRLFWEQTSRDIYLTIGFYNVDSTQTRVEFQTDSILCRTKIRTYDRFVRIYLTHNIIPEKCLFQVRRANILLTIRKGQEGLMWTTLTNRRIEPRPEFFTIEYGSDDESETEKRRRTVNQQWEQIRDEKRQLKLNNDDNKYLIDDLDDDDDHQQPTDKLNNIDNEDNQQELTDTSSDCHSTDSDDCYYEDQVPANHIPQGYDEADYDHRFYGQQLRS